MTLPAPEDVPDDVKEIIGLIVQAGEAIGKAQVWLDTARDDRDHHIALLRTKGWTLRQISLLTGLSISGLEKISRQQGVRTTRGAEIPAAR